MAFVDVSTIASMRYVNSRVSTVSREMTYNTDSYSVYYSGPVDINPIPATLRVTLLGNMAFITLSSFFVASAGSTAYILITSDTIGTRFTLPAMYRPVTDQAIITALNNEGTNFFGFVIVDHDGYVTIANYARSTFTMGTMISGMPAIQYTTTVV